MVFIGRVNETIMYRGSFRPTSDRIDHAHFSFKLSSSGALFLQHPSG